MSNTFWRMFVRPCLAPLGLVLLLAGCKAGLYSNLNESEANEMVAALATEGIRMC